MTDPLFVLVTILFALWVALLLLFKRLKLHFFLFLVGSVGLFGFLMFFGLNAVGGDDFLEYYVAFFSQIIGGLTGLFDVFPEYSMILIHYGKTAISFFIDYECSGFVETLVFCSLIAFYPVFRTAGKLLCMIGGSIFIFISNLIRVTVICIIIKFLGPSSIFLAHTIVARLIFFGLMVFLYYFVFTRIHVLRQKVGGLEYEHK